MILDRMPEGEVAIRLAEHLLTLPGAGATATVAVDGAGVSVGGVAVFDIVGHLVEAGWLQVHAAGKNAWTGRYERSGHTLVVHSRSGVGDVETTLGGRRVLAECKKGPLIRKTGSPERPRLFEALGQALLLDVEPDDVVVAAVPDTPAFRAVAEKMRARPLLKRVGIFIALVNRDGTVAGLDELSAST